MKKIKKAFTFIEILITISMFAMVWYLSFSSFWKNIEIQNISSNLTNQLDFIFLFDKELWVNFTDYKITLEKDKNHIIYELDNNYKSQNQTITSVTDTQITFSNTAYLKVFKDNKIEVESWITNTENYYSDNEINIIDIETNYDYLIKTTKSWEELNQVWIKFLKEISGLQTTIYKFEDKNWNELSWPITIYNTLWKNKIIKNNWIKIDDFYVLLETEWTITKIFFN